MAENQPPILPRPAGPPQLPRGMPVNARPFAGWPPGATELDVEHLLLVSVRLVYDTATGPQEWRYGGLCHGWHGRDVLVQVPARGRWLFDAGDVERESIDLE